MKFILAYSYTLLSITLLGANYSYCLQKCLGIRAYWLTLMTQLKFM